jgi:hypothetical protein
LRRADCDTDHYPVAAKVRERLAINKRVTQMTDMEKFNTKSVDEVEGNNSIRLKSQTGTELWKLSGW